MDSLRNEKIKNATDTHTELMDLVFKMYCCEDVDFGHVTNLLRKAYSDQLSLINALYQPKATALEL